MDNNWCQWCEEVGNNLYCMKGFKTDKCKGNKYNCCKQRYKDQAINKLSNREKVRRQNISTK
jgi:hypothetical protein